jgi:hypothetical protein
MSDTKEYVIRVEGTANRYGLGEVVVPGVTLFKDNGQPGGKFYNLTRVELNALIARTGKRK